MGSLAASVANDPNPETCGRSADMNQGTIRAIAWVVSALGEDVRIANAAPAGWMGCCGWMSCGCGGQG